jgi:phosphate starvation-inducible protein PhoH and related proteins
MSKRKSRYATKSNVHRIGFHVIPKNEKQDRLVRSIKAYPLTVTIGCAGTGKTYCSAGTVASLFLQGKHNKIVVTRANVPTGKSLGHFPGTIQDKMTPWLLPMLEVFQEAFGKDKYKYMMNKSEIEIQPIETIRGRSYKDSLVLVDEAQNLTVDELKAISTRLGENSKLVLMGDPAQSDVRKGQDLLKFCSLVKKNNISLPVIKFSVDDIVRSDIVAELVRMFIKEKI